MIISSPLVLTQLTTLILAFCAHAFVPAQRTILAPRALLLYEASEWYTPPPPTPRPTTTGPSQVEEESSPGTIASHETTITAPEQLDALLQDTNRVLVVKYHAGWCRSCKKLALHMQPVRRHYYDSVHFADVEWSANPDLCRDIESLPTTRIYCQGTLIKEITGGATKIQRIREAIEYAVQKQARERATQQLEQTLDRGKELLRPHILAPPLFTPPPPLEAFQPTASSSSSSASS